jgi:hypothetical protein
MYQANVIESHLTNSNQGVVALPSANLAGGFWHDEGV